LRAEELRENRRRALATELREAYDARQWDAVGSLAATMDRERLTRPALLHNAVQLGDVDGVGRLLELGWSADDRHDGYVSEVFAGGHQTTHCAADGALNAAVGRRDLAMVRLLVEKGASVDYYSWSNDSTLPIRPLAYAARLGDIAIFKYLMSAGADPCGASQRRSTTEHATMPPLVEAARQGHIAVMEELVRAGADVNERMAISGWGDLTIPTWFGDQAIHQAVMTGQVAVVEFLLSKGADIRSRGYDNQTPLERALQPRVRQAEMVALLQDAERSASS
jgi:hypothetical protein